MKKLALIIAFAALAATPALATVQYTDTNGVVWTIEGPAVGKWRPFAGAAANCPSHHVTAEPTALGTGLKMTKQQIAAAKASGVQTMHIVCLPGPAAAVPAANPPLRVVGDQI